jgi:hypothetical protein
MKEDIVMSEDRMLALMSRLEYASKGEYSTALSPKECALLLDYMNADKRTVKPADVADKIVQMLNQTVTDQDMLIERLLDIVTMLAKRKAQ